jgi:hypothetical protein
MGERSDTQLTSISKARTLEEIGEFWDTAQDAAPHFSPTGTGRGEESGAACVLVCVKAATCTLQFA